MDIKKIGFCCKYIENDAQINGIKAKDNAKQYTVSTTKLTWLKAQSAKTAEDKLWDLTKSNIEAIRKLVKLVGGFTPELRMVRIGSDVLPMYTEPTFSNFYKRSDVINYMEKNFAEVGKIARENNVRLSFHPDQFCVLASSNPDTVEKSILEMEYHADMARYMGYGKSFHDYGFKINVHISGALGANGIRSIFNKMSVEARNLITIENEENVHGLDQCLELADILPIVLDIHHYWNNTGEYIFSNDDKVKRVIDSWRGIRPAMHYSVSREDLLVNHTKHSLPDFNELKAMGYNSQELRAHSDYFWNESVNDYALSFWDDFDIQCEAKAKNLASFQLYNYAKQNKLVNI